MRITIDISEEEDLSMKNAGVAVGDNGISEMEVSFGDFVLVMTWDQMEGLRDAISEWLTPDEEKEGAVVATKKAPNDGAVRQSPAPETP